MGSDQSKWRALRIGIPTLPPTVLNWKSTEWLIEKWKPGDAIIPMKRRTILLLLILVFLAACIATSHTPSLPTAQTTITIQRQTPTTSPRPAPTPHTTPDYPQVYLDQAGQIGGALGGLDVRGAYAYLGEGPRLVVIDVNNPVSPMIVARSEVLAGLVERVNLVGDFAYLLIESQLWVVDISNPLAPSPIYRDALINPGLVKDLKIVDDILFLLDEVCDSEHCRDYLRAFDIANPAYPSEMSSLSLPGEARSLDVAQGYAFVAADGVQVIDVHDPYSIKIIGQFGPEMKYGTLIWDRDYIYIPVQTGLWIYDVSDSEHPRQVDVIPMKDFLSFPGWPHIRDVQNSVAYSGTSFCDVCGCMSNVSIIDMSNPFDPVLISEFNAGGSSINLDVFENRIYIAVSDGDFLILDIQDLTKPVKIGGLDMVGGVYSVEISDTFAYLDANGLQIVDISSTNDLQQVGSTGFRSGCGSDVEVLDDYAYRLIGGGSLQMIDLADPTNPTIVGEYYSIEGCGGVAVSPDFVYACGIYVIDPTHPIQLTRIESPKIFYGTWIDSDLIIEDGFAFGSKVGDFGMMISDLSDPKEPVSVSFFPTVGFIEAITTEGPHAYLAADDGIYSVDISDLTQPIQAGFLPIENIDFGDSARTLGDYLYVSTSNAGLLIVDICNPEKPTILGVLTAIENVKDMEIINGLIYTATGHEGMVIFRALEE